MSPPPWLTTKKWPEHIPHHHPWNMSNIQVARNPLSPSPTLFFRLCRIFMRSSLGSSFGRWCFKLFCCFVAARLGGISRNEAWCGDTCFFQDFFQIYTSRPKNWGKNRSHLTVWMSDVSIINWRGRLNHHWDTNEWLDVWDVSVSIPDGGGEIFSPKTSSENLNTDIYDDPGYLELCKWEKPFQLQTWPLQTSDLLINMAFAKQLPAFWVDQQKSANMTWKKASTFHHKVKLGGGNSKMFYVHPENWGNDPIWLSYFSKGLVQPPTSESIPKQVGNYTTWLDQKP